MFHLSARSAFQELPVRAAIKGEGRWWSVSGRPIHDEYGNFVGFRGSGTDLTEKKRSQEHASRLAHYDSLTGLANRFQMSQALDKILTSQHEKNRVCAVLLLDLDRFKHVNDTMGHPAGDALLKQVAQRLERAVGQAGQVGRLGGDEFKVIVPGRIERAQLGQLATEIIHTLSQPYSIDGQRVVIGASVGVALSPDDGLTSEELIRNADLALYAAKDLGRGRFHFYADDLHAEAEARAQIERDLRDAIAHGQLELYYQPVDLDRDREDRRVRGAAALAASAEGLDPARQVRPDRRGQRADRADRRMGAAHRVPRRSRSWPEDVRVAVNVSPLQFANPQLPAIVTSAIAQAGIHPSRLELEITESVFLNDDEGTDAMFAALKRVGVRLALDDFGTGYSSLGYLKKAPFDKIKIDQSFVRGATAAGQPQRRDHRRDQQPRAGARHGHHRRGRRDARRARPRAAARLQPRPGLHLRARAQRRGGHRAAAGPAWRRCPAARAPRARRARRCCARSCSTITARSTTRTIRNISATGALVEGLWNVPVGTIFKIHVSDSAGRHRHHALVRGGPHGDRVRHAAAARRQRPGCRVAQRRRSRSFAGCSRRPAERRASPGSYAVW